jgi:argininosuccinate synthase
VRIKLYKGNCMIVGRKSDDSLYSADIATFDASTLYDQKDATGFLNLYGLPIKVEAMMRNRKK